LSGRADLPDVPSLSDRGGIRAWFGRRSLVTKLTAVMLAAGTLSLSAAFLALASVRAHTG
jgi:hypothetical protein